MIAPLMTKTRMMVTRPTAMPPSAALGFAPVHMPMAIGTQVPAQSRSARMKRERTERPLVARMMAGMLMITVMVCAQRTVTRGCVEKRALNPVWIVSAVEATMLTIRITKSTRRPKGSSLIRKKAAANAMYSGTYNSSPYLVTAIKPSTPIKHKTVICRMLAPKIPIVWLRFEPADHTRCQLPAENMDAEVTAMMSVTKQMAPPPVTSALPEAMICALLTGV
mmetsp:Transcript_29001/g.66618  ORF Transcript_29001/g.66618 Transcript_29001/m.66618 type:complete len:222 (+) Transcript_29001:435-1100(+)